MVNAIIYQMADTRNRDSQNETLIVNNDIAAGISPGILQGIRSQILDINFCSFLFLFNIRNIALVKMIIIIILGVVLLTHLYMP